MKVQKSSFASVVKIGAGGLSLALIVGAAWFIGSPARHGEADVAAEGSPILGRPVGPVASPDLVSGGNPARASQAAREPVPTPEKTARVPTTSPIARALPGHTRPAVDESPVPPTSGNGSARLRPDSGSAVTSVASAGDARGLEESAQSGALGTLSVPNATELAALAASAVASEDVTEVGEAKQTMEEALLVGAAKAADPATPNLVARNAMDRLIGAFVTERTEEAKQDLLAAGAELARDSGQSAKRLLDLALQPQQPLDVQQQALHLAAVGDPAAVEKVAANPDHPLQLEAEAFLRERRIAAGIRIPDRDDAPAAQLRSPRGDTLSADR